MKKILALTILAAFVFCIITTTTAEIYIPLDGDNSYGYPLTFYTRFSEMCFDCPKPSFVFSYWKLLLDLLFSAFIALLFEGAFISLRVLKSKSKEQKSE